MLDLLTHIEAVGIIIFYWLKIVQVTIQLTVKDGRKFLMIIGFLLSVYMLTITVSTQIELIDV
jgi:hypothetical protein